MDGGYYRGTNTDQDLRFTDKEKKLMKQMKFEPWLDQKVDMSKVNVDVLKPWITGKLNTILGMEDDVVINMVFYSLEEENLNPKRLQINLAGFLNARKAREFMGELWQMMLDAQASEDGIPSALIEQKMADLKAQGGPVSEVRMADATENDWKNRYKSLTGGRYGKNEPDYRSEALDSQQNRWEAEKRRERSPERRRRDPERGRDDGERRERREERVRRDHSRSRSKERRNRRERSRERRRESPEADEPARRRFTEEKPRERKFEEKPQRSGSEEKHKKRKRHDSEETAKKSKKHKKDKKKKHKRERNSSEERD